MPVHLLFTKLFLHLFLFTVLFLVTGDATYKGFFLEA